MGSLINTGQLVPGGTTTVLIDKVGTSSAQHQTFTLSGFGLAQLDVNGTLTFTNTTGAAVDVEVTFSGLHTLTVNGSPAGVVTAKGMFLYETINGTSTGYLTPAGFDANSIGNSASANWRASGVWHTTLAAGDVGTWKTQVLFQGTASLGGSLDTTNGVLRVTVVKR